MKNFVLTFIMILLSSLSIAQTQQGTVEVYGTAHYERKVECYQVEIEIIRSVAEYNSHESPPLSMDQLEVRFFKNMKEAGFGQNEFEPARKNDYYTMENPDERRFYTFETTSEERFIEFIKLKKADWIYYSNKKVTYKPFTEKEKIITEAIEDARKNATVLAKVMGTKTGRILSISDFHYETDSLPSFSLEDHLETYRIAVKFAVE